MSHAIGSGCLPPGTALIKSRSAYRSGQVTFVKDSHSFTSAKNASTRHLLNARSTAASTSGTGTTSSESCAGSGSHTPISKTCPESTSQPISAVASRLLDPSKNITISAPSGTTCAGSALAAHACGVVHASPGALARFRSLRLESSGRADGPQARRPIGRTSTPPPGPRFQSQSPYTHSRARRSESGSDMSVSGGAIRASYRTRDSPRSRPSSCATQSSQVASATAPIPGFHAFAVSSKRDPDLARLSASVAISSGPPFDGTQCSVSSATANDPSAPSAAVADEVSTPSAPSGSLDYFVLPGSKPHPATTAECFGAKARTIRIVFAVCDSAVAAICTSGMSTGRPAHPPGRRESFRASRTGAQNSINASAAANGDLPDPFA